MHVIDFLGAPGGAELNLQASDERAARLDEWTRPYTDPGRRELIGF